MSLTAYPTLRLKLTMPQALKLQFLPAIPGSNAAAAADRAEQAAQDAQNAANTAVAATTNKVDKAGDVMTGFLTLNADPLANLQAATKQYVDAHASGIQTINSQTGPAITLIAGTNVTIDNPSANQIRIASSGGGGGGAPIGAEYITSTTDATLTAERVLTDTASITWDRTTPGQIKASTAAGGGNVSNSGTPTVGQYAKWLTATTIQGVPVATVLSDIGAQPIDADLTAIAALAGTNTIYYRSASNTWSAVNVSTGLAFSGGNLTATGTGAPVGAEYITSTADATLTSERVLTDTATVTWDRTTTGQIKATAVPVVAKKNYIINGAMMVSQENGSTAGTISGYYAVDQWLNFSANSGAWSFGQVITTAANGISNRLRFTCTTADATVGAADQAVIAQAIEGLRMNDLKFASTAPKTITIQFGVKAPAGTYCLGITNATTDRCYVAEYVIAAGEANIEVVKSVTIVGDNGGVWGSGNGIGMYVQWILMAGSNFVTTPGVWTSSVNKFTSTNQFNFMGTAGNVFELFDVGLYEGTVAPAFQVPDYASELRLCQRYFEFDTTSLILQSPAAGTISTPFTYLVQKRAVPTITFPTVTYTSAAGLAAVGAGKSYTTFQVTASVAAGFAQFTLKADARM